jgi:hypothetical protein
MIRELTSHKSNELNEVLRVTAVDDLGPGNASHRYRIEPTVGNALGLLIEFQNGPLKETVYPNGVTNEALLAVVIDRLQGFQSGPYACRENAIALTKLQEAMHWLHHRTRERVSRGVEGTNNL